jgi:hypothetical protein
MESIGLCQEVCPEHGRIMFIQYLPEETIVSQEAIDYCGSWMVQTDDSLTILGANGIAVYEIVPIDESCFYATFRDWHAYDPPVVRHEHSLHTLA